MEFKRDLLMPRGVLSQLTLASKNLDAHSFLSGLSEHARAEVEKILTETNVQLRAVLNEEFLKWNSEHP
jgi:hypothetical protein